METPLPLKSEIKFVTNTTVPLTSRIKYLRDDPPRYEERSGDNYDNIILYVVKQRERPFRYRYGHMGTELIRIKTKLFKIPDINFLTSLEITRMTNSVVFTYYSSGEKSYSVRVANNNMICFTNYAWNLKREYEQKIFIMDSFSIMPGDYCIEIILY